MLSFKLLLNFYLTLLIPLFYFFGLIIIVKTPNTLPFLFLGSSVLRFLGSSVYQFFRSSVLPFIGFLSSLFGLLLWLSSFLTLGRHLTVLPQAKKLLTTGPYRFFRHPIYLGITLTLFGLSLALSSLPGLLFTLFIIIPLNVIRAQKEEKLLLKQFPQEYQHYCTKTRW